MLRGTLIVISIGVQLQRFPRIAKKEFVEHNVRKSSLEGGCLRILRSERSTNVTACSPCSAQKPTGGNFVSVLQSKSADPAAYRIDILRVHRMGSGPRSQNSVVRVCGQRGRARSIWH